MSTSVSPLMDVNIRRMSTSSTDVNIFNGCQHLQRMSTSSTDVNIFNGCQHLQRMSTSSTDANIFNGCQHLQRMPTSSTDANIFNGCQHPFHLQRMPTSVPTFNGCQHPFPPSTDANIRSHLQRMPTSVPGTTLPLCSSTQKIIEICVLVRLVKLVSVELVECCCDDGGNSRFILGVSKEVFGRRSSFFVKYSEEVFILCEDSKEV
ncbi:hypothetical protein LR48_Vigan07g182000 [Vigna angularis]|uniref:Uncharacterized protein n=1 Tax=Phaseolus angularis TaxID=3914 RepID=A0A0L9UZI7_PHAAN|nr:hypothetical protein LR48_Vigan07g182000 [Vigna angularis]